jgi:membrane-bound lytic murein transglycosylase MltF
LLKSQPKTNTEMKFQMNLIKTSLIGCVPQKLLATIVLALCISPALLAAGDQTFGNKRELRTFQQMLDARVIRVLVVRNKTNYFFDGAQQRGVTYDMLKLFETDLNQKLKRGHLQIHVVFIPVRRDQLIPALLDGRGDIAAANLTITRERQELVDFSIPFYKNVRELIITPGGSESMSSINELSGKEVYVRDSSSYHDSLLKANGTLESRGMRPIKIVLADEKLEDEDLLEMVNARLIPAIVVDSHKAHFWAQIFDNIVIHEELALRHGGSIAAAFRKNSPELETVLNDFMKKNRKGTLMGNIMFKRYLQNTEHVSNALDTSEMEKFNATVALFQTYAKTYDFDWLMLIAQAYQESRLDQSTRSSAGALGVMQLLPTTAADKSVGIADISTLENNIHAGAKYMRWLRDNYFSDPDMTSKEQTLFSFAAYNAGPGKVRRLRKEATEMGLDPNVWFDNVEVVAAKRIGRETVQYVSNIYKYWIAYRLSVELREQADAGL